MGEAFAMFLVVILILGILVITPIMVAMLMLGATLYLRMDAVRRR